TMAAALGVGEPSIPRLATILAVPGPLARRQAGPGGRAGARRGGRAGPGLAGRQLFPRRRRRARVPGRARGSRALVGGGRATRLHGLAADGTNEPAAEVPPGGAGRR